MITMTRVLLPVLALSGSALGWDPNNGDWTKSDATDLRVMTWNVEDCICSTAFKDDAFNSWNATVRIVTALKPDILILQEMGDNSGNGTGGGGDSVGNLETAIDLFINGGSDPFRGGVPVGSYIKKFDPALDYPYVFVSTDDDNFNRNVIMSRYPFADLNMDVSDSATRSDIVVLPDKYAQGFDGGIRGYMWAEIDLPDDVYLGDVVVGNGHLKAFGGNGSSEWMDRIRAAQNVAYWIDHFYNGALTGEPDPNNKIPFDDADTVILDDCTPAIWGGDWNDTPGDGPAEWMYQAQVPGGPGGDGPDRDGSDAQRDFASHPLTGDTSTQSSNKLDYLAWQDSIATARREIIFRTSNGWPTGVPYPAPVDTFPPVPQSASSTASDHRPVIVDFILPLVGSESRCAPEPTCQADANGDGVVDLADLNTVLAWWGFDTSQPGAEAGDLNGDDVVDVNDLNIVLSGFNQPC